MWWGGKPQTAPAGGAAGSGSGSADHVPRAPQGQVNFDRAASKAREQKDVRDGQGRVPWHQDHHLAVGGGWEQHSRRSPGGVGEGEKWRK